MGKYEERMRRRRALVTVAIAPAVSKWRVAHRLKQLQQCIRTRRHASLMPQSGTAFAAEAPWVPIQLRSADLDDSPCFPLTGVGFVPDESFFPPENVTR